MTTSVQLGINKKLHSYNEFKLRGGAKFNQIRRAEIGRWQREFLLAMKSNIQYDDLSTLFQYARKLNCPVQFIVDYGQPRPFDTDNAMSGANKLIIDPLVRDGVIPDDTTRWIRPLPPTHHKAHKPYVEVTFRLDMTVKEIMPG